MRIEKFRVDVFRVKAFCECGGELVTSGVWIRTAAGSVCEHICSKCGIREDIKNVKYPYTEYVDVVEEGTKSE